MLYGHVNDGLCVCCVSLAPGRAGVCCLLFVFVVCAFGGVPLFVMLVDGYGLLLHRRTTDDGRRRKRNDWGC